jgi:hypothetical protein
MCLKHAASFDSREKPPSASKTKQKTQTPVAPEPEERIQREHSSESIEKRTSSESTWNPRHPQMVMDNGE